MAKGRCCANFLTLTLDQNPDIRFPSDPRRIYVLDNVRHKPMMIASGDVFVWTTTPSRSAELNDDVCLHRIASGIEETYSTPGPETLF